MTEPADRNRCDQYGQPKHDRAWGSPADASQVAQLYEVGASGSQGSCHHLEVVPVQDVFGEIVAQLCLICDAQLPADWRPQPAPGAPGQTDRWAIAAFVLGIVGVVPGAVGCGIVALRRIGRSRQSAPPGNRGAVLVLAT
jgi:hypothetical protein